MNDPAQQLLAVETLVATISRLQKDLVRAGKGYSTSTQLTDAEIGVCIDMFRTAGFGAKKEASLIELIQEAMVNTSAYAQALDRSKKQTNDLKKEIEDISAILKGGEGVGAKTTATILTSKLRALTEIVKTRLGKIEKSKSLSEVSILNAEIDRFLAALV